MEELKRCPICGGKAYWFHELTGVSIACENEHCGFYMRLSIDYDDCSDGTIDDDKRKLADVWNSVDRTKTPKKEEKEDDDDYI